MTFLIIAIIISTFALFLSLRTKGVIQKIITIGLITSFFLIYAFNNIFIFSFLLQWIMGITTIIYASIIKELRMIDKLTIGATGLFFTLRQLFTISHNPFQFELTFLFLIPIVVYIIFNLKTWRQPKRESGFMLLWALIAFVLISKNFIK